MRDKRTAITASALLLLIVAAVYFRRGGDETDPTAKPISKPLVVTALTKSGVASAVPRRKAKIELGERAESAFDPYEEWPLDKILTRFMVPPGTFEAADTSGAIALLQQIYAEHSDGRMLNIRLVAPEKFGQVFAFEHENISFQKLLGIVAALGHYKANVTESGIELLPLGGNNPIEARIAVPPHFIHSVNVDPFGGEVALDPKFEPKMVFERYGIAFGDDVGIIADPRTSHWTLSGPTAEVERIKSLLEATRSSLQQQVLITNKIVAIENGTTVDPRSFTDPEFQVAIRALSQQPGVDLMTAPSVVTRPGQRAKVEIMHAMVYPSDGSDPSALETQHVGMSIEIHPILAGLDRVQLGGAAELTGFDGQGLSDYLHDYSLDPNGPTFNNAIQAQKRTNITADSFRTHATDFAGELYDGNTALFPIAQEDGTVIYQFITAQVIDPSGQPILRPDPIPASDGLVPVERVGSLFPE